MDIYIVTEINHDDDERSTTRGQAFKSLKEAKDEVYNCEVEYIKDMQGSDFDIKMLDHLDFGWKEVGENTYRCHPENDFDTEEYTITKVELK